MKTALVISGGGAKGAFAVGVLQFIHENIQRIDEFDIYCGTSTGALITPFAMQGDAGLTILNDIYTTSVQSDVLLFGNVGNLLDSQAISVHDASPLRDLINSTFTSNHFQNILTSGKRLFIATVCLQTQSLVYFCTQPVPSTQDYEIITIQNLNEWRRVMLASSNQPVWMQPIRVQSTSNPLRQFNDGGVRELTPLQAAVDSGATTIFSITLSPSTEPPIDQIFGSAFSILERTLDMLSEDVSHNDYRVPRLYRDANLYIDQVVAKLVELNVSQADIDSAFQVQNSPFSNRPLRQIHEIRPLAKLEKAGPGGLIFNPVDMQEMLQMGRDRAEDFFNNLNASNQPVLV